VHKTRKTTKRSQYKPSIDFYLSLGAKPLDDWTMYRMDEAAIAALAK